ncbi:MAG: acetyl-CoA decarbonylase/synthase complex subunit beta 1, partial [Candidatus Bathyarchaeia archaeon]
MTYNFLEALLQGTRRLAAEAERMTDELSASYGLEISVSYPGTIYNLPVVYGLTGRKINTLKDVRNELFLVKSSLSKPIDDQNSRELGQIALTCLEIVEALNHVGNKPLEKPCVGFIPDVVFRELSLGLADGTIPGIVGLAGESSENEKLKKLLLTIKERSLLCLLMGPVIRQAQGLSLELGLNSKLIPVEYRPTAVAHFMNLLIRAPLMFGGITPGMKDEILEYIKERVPAFILYLGKAGESELAAVNGISSLNVPVITDQSQLSTLENVHYQTEHSAMVEKGCELKGIKLRPGVKPEIPVDYGPMYEGEKIRREDMHIEFGGSSAVAFEIVKIVKPNEVVDGAVNIQGPDLEDLKEGSSAPLAIIVKLAGAGLEEELEPVLERRIHQFMNQCQGLMHLGQRSDVWIRISKEAVKNGLRLKHIGSLLHMMFHSTFPQLVEKVEVELLTDQELVMKRHAEAESTYAERDERLRALKEEEVDSFYGCTLCQSFAPTHVCVI